MEGVKIASRFEVISSPTPRSTSMAKSSTPSANSPSTESVSLDMDNIRFGACFVTTRVNSEINEIESDQKRIKQIIFNMVSNACKFTNNGDIYLRVFLINETCKSSIKVEIEDTGIGMNDDQLKKLFQSYSQADISVSSKYGGTGLGLKISQLLARLLGGDITVNSLVNKGTIFTVTFIPEKVY